MDAKLAKGFMRQGFRDDLRATDRLAQEGMDALLPLLMPLKKRGKLKKDEAKALIEKDSLLKSDPHYTVFVERFANPAIKALSPAFDMALVGGAMMPGSWPLDGHVEQVRALSLFYDRVRLVAFEHRVFQCSVFLREHAISRFLERTNARYRSVTEALWPGLLLLELIDRAQNDSFANAFLLPCAKGALFGMQVREKLPEGHRCAFSITISKKEPEFSDLSLNNPSYPLMSFINTFVDSEALRPSQQRVCDEVLALLKRHEAALIYGLLSRIMLLNGEHDDLALNIRFPRDGLDVVVLDYRRLVNSSDCRTAVRLPSESVFKKYVEMQQRHELAINGAKTQ